MEEQENEVSSDREKIRQLERDLDDLRAYNARIDNDYAVAREMIRSGRGEREDLLAVVTTLNERIAHQRKEIQELEYEKDIQRRLYEQKEKEATSPSDAVIEELKSKASDAVIEELKSKARRDEISLKAAQIKANNWRDRHDELFDKMAVTEKDQERMQGCQNEALSQLQAKADEAAEQTRNVRNELTTCQMKCLVLESQLRTATNGQPQQRPDSRVQSTVDFNFERNKLKWEREEVEREKSTLIRNLNEARKKIEELEMIMKRNEEHKEEKLKVDEKLEEANERILELENLSSVEIKRCGRLEKEIEELNVQIEDLRKSKSQADQDPEGTRKRLEEMERQIESYEIELKSKEGVEEILAEDNATLLNENAKVTGEIADLRQKMEDMERAAKLSKENMQAEMDERRRRILELERLSDVAITRCRQLEIKIEDSSIAQTDDVRKTKSQADQDLAEARKRLEEMESQLESVQVEIQSKEGLEEILRDENTTLVNENSKVTGENADLRQKMEDMERAAKLSTEKMQAEMEQLRIRDSESASLRSQCVELKKEMEQCKVEIDKWKEDVERKADSIKKLENDVEKLQEENGSEGAGKAESVKKMEEVIEKLTREKEELVHEKSSLLQCHNETLKKIGDTESLLRKNEGLEEEKLKLSESLEQKNERILELERLSDVAISRQFESEIEKSHAQIEYLRKAKSQTDQDLEETRKRLEEMESQLESVEVELQSRECIDESLRDEISTLLIEKDSNIEHHRRKCEELEKEVKQCKAEIDKWKEDVDRKSDSINKLEIEAEEMISLLISVNAKIALLLSQERLRWKEERNSLRDEVEGMRTSQSLRSTHEADSQQRVKLEDDVNETPARFGDNVPERSSNEQNQPDDFNFTRSGISGNFQSNRVHRSHSESSLFPTHFHPYMRQPRGGRASLSQAIPEREGSPTKQANSSLHHPNEESGGT